MKSYKENLSTITTFIFDVDGVLTNGDVLLVPGGVWRTMNSKDGYAMQYAVKKGYKIYIITGGYSEDVKASLEGLGVHRVCLRSSNKLLIYNQLKEEEGFNDQEVVYMGDDIPDIPVLKTVGVSTCPQDAAIDVLNLVDYQSPINGGKGCVRDIIEQVLRVQGKWMNEDAFSW